MKALMKWTMIAAVLMVGIPFFILVYIAIKVGAIPDVELLKELPA